MSATKHPPPLLLPMSRAANRIAKQQARAAEDAARIQRRVAMTDAVQLQALHDFVAAMGATLAPPAIRVTVPLWDVAALVSDATALLTSFTPAAQYGELHGGAWKTLSLRSCDGSIHNDRAGPTYHDTPAWAASTYIVPHLLRSLEAADVPASSLQRVRLSVIAPDCNVAWHVDYTDTATLGPLRVHVPVVCSPGFTMDIGGRDVVMREGETWVGQFELPHRLGNADGCVARIHLVVDVWPQRTGPASELLHVAPLAHDGTLHLGGGVRGENGAVSWAVGLLSYVCCQHV